MYAALADKGPRGLAIRIRLWDHYSKDPTLASRQLFYLSAFKGAVLYYGQNENSATEAALEGSARLNYFVATVGGTARAAVNRASTMQVKKFGVFISKTTEAPWTPIATLSLLDGPAQIADWVKRASPPAVIPSGSGYLLPRSTFPHVVSIEGMPEENCKDGRLTVANSEKVTIAKIAFDGRSCVVSATYDTSTVDFSEQALSDTETIAYGLRYGEKIAGNEILFPVSMKGIPKRRDINIGAPIADVRGVANRERSLVTWQVPIVISDENARLPSDFALTFKATDSTCDELDLSKIPSKKLQIADRAKGTILEFVYAPTLKDEERLGTDGKPCYVSFGVKVTAGATRIDQRVLARIIGPVHLIPMAPSLPAPPAAPAPTPVVPLAPISFGH
jgi:hypothetical protein